MLFLLLLVAGAGAAALPRVHVQYRARGMPARASVASATAAGAALGNPAHLRAIGTRVLATDGGSRPGAALCVNVSDDRTFYAAHGKAWTSALRDGPTPAIVIPPAPPLPADVLATAVATLAVLLAPFAVTVGRGTCAGAAAVQPVLLLAAHPPLNDDPNILGMGIVGGLRGVTGGGKAPPALVVAGDAFFAGDGGVRLGRAMAHEVGHAVGLNHDTHPTGTSAYYAGIAPAFTAPVMGWPYDAATAHWSRGLYMFAHVHQDDVRVWYDAYPNATVALPAAGGIPDATQNETCAVLGAGTHWVAFHARPAGAALGPVHVHNAHTVTVVRNVWTPRDIVNVSLQRDTARDLWRSEAAGIVCVQRGTGATHVDVFAAAPTVLPPAHADVLDRFWPYALESTSVATLARTVALGAAGLLVVLTYLARTFEALAIARSAAPPAPPPLERAFQWTAARVARLTDTLGYPPELSPLLH